MRLLYKYSGYLGLNYFDHPTITLSMPLGLNDPFESNISEHIYKHFSNYVNSDIATLQNLKKTLNNYLNLVGVTSLSETNRNLLMWAHYAKEHTGICLGISSEFMSHKEHETYNYTTRHKIETMAFPQKINYDSSRFDLNENSQLDINRFANGEFFNDYLKHHLLKKSDEWIYEKEHRTIMPLTSCDGFKDINLNDNKVLKEYIEEGVTAGHIIKCKHDEKYYKFKDNVFKYMYISIMCHEDKNYAKGIMFLCEIKPEHIKAFILDLGFLMRK